MIYINLYYFVRSLFAHSLLRSSVIFSMGGGSLCESEVVECGLNSFPRGVDCLCPRGCAGWCYMQVWNALLVFGFPVFCAALPIRGHPAPSLMGVRGQGWFYLQFPVLEKLGLVMLRLGS